MTEPFLTRDEALAEIAEMEARRKAVQAFKRRFAPRLPDDEPEPATPRRSAAARAMIAA